MKALSDYMRFLYACRFCPMCKPAAEVANITHIESYSTRARAMMLWRVASGIAEFTQRDVELIYQCTLDSISQSWCVNHYPVSEYMVSARAEILRRGLAPKSVRDVLRHSITESEDIKGDVILLSSEACELGNKNAIDPALNVLENAGISAEPVFIQCGALAYGLGDFKKALEQAERLIDIIKNCGIKFVIADGPATLFTIRYIYPFLDILWPKDIEVRSLSEELSRALEQKKLKIKFYDETKVIFHDSRCACLLADDMAQDEAIQPGFQGPETALGKGEVYEAPRRIVDALGMERIFFVWSRSLSRSCGADDGLWITYPELAKELALKRMQEAEKLGAEMIITDSLLCAYHLKSNGNGIPVRWLCELFE